MSLDQNDKLKRDIGIGIVVGLIGGYLKARFEGKSDEDVAISTIASGLGGGVAGGVKNKLEEANNSNNPRTT